MSLHTVLLLNVKLSEWYPLIPPPSFLPHLVLKLNDLNLFGIATLMPLLE